MHGFLFGKRPTCTAYIALILAYTPAILACEVRETADHLQARDTTTDYFGQPRPGAEPVLFAEGVVSTEDGMYGTVVFSPDQTEAFWAKDEHPGLFFSRLTEGAWTVPAEFPFPATYRLSSPFFSADGNRLYFMIAGRGEAGMDTEEQIWVVDREGTGWGEPRELHPQVNAVEKHWQFSLDEAGNVFFCGEGADLYLSTRRGEEYLAPVRLPSPINTDAPETSPHISPDGSVLLFDRWFQSAPYIRIFVSFKNSDGAWTEPIDLSPHTESEGNDSAARLTPDGKYLFFQSAREGSDANRSVYWMEADFLQELRAESFAPTESGGGSPVTVPPSLLYLGESLPGATPIPFARDIITEELHSSPVFSPEGHEVYWGEMGGGGIQFMELVNGEWIGPREAPFNLPYSGEPVFGPHGETLYFDSQVQFEGSQREWDENVWFVVRTAEGWSDPEPLGAVINAHPMHWGVSLATGGNLYIGNTEGSRGIFVSESRNGALQEPVPLGPAVNTEDWEGTPHIAPDERYLLFSRNSESGVDLFVSFREPGGEWMEAVPIVGVNTPEREICPRVSPDGEFLFFLRRVEGDLRPFWVRSTVISDLRPR